MSGLETAIRNALERSERTNAEARARVYQSARQALETGLRKQNIDDPEAINYQRRRLEALIHEIELEERARLEVRPEPPVSQVVPPAVSPAAAPVRAAPEPAVSSTTDRRMGRVEPGFASVEPADRTPEPAREPSFADDISVSPDVARDAHADDEGPMPDMRSERPLKAPRRRRGVVARLMILSIFLATLGIGAWWVYSSGLLLSEAERDTSVPNPPPRVEAEDFSGTPEPATPAAPAGPQAIDARGGFSDDWIEVFEPQQVSALRPRANALVDIVTASDGNAAQIVSRSADAAGAVEVTVPTEILRELAGRTSTIALTMQSTDDKPVQISVECDFPRMGDCPRHRFTVNPQKLDALFRVSFDNGMAPSTPGRLLINADLAGEGRGVNLYAIRILPGQ
ncbi:hypothetical protein [Rhizobium rosettiformans]|uniref:hypothetical protein n=1 Tax=Rhizobium rosettiformans TaxID=1368430 RepID=UPI00286090B2|nr:hypothetical protein [Rhizobium rosettiformans]MDR7028373.1 hypothetical protein [Rhizobium rosettiformans]MDR7064345.1 hypothetical protein [Rhizobium rosettiformans]